MMLPNESAEHALALCSTVFLMKLSSPFCAAYRNSIPFLNRSSSLS